MAQKKTQEELQIEKQIGQQVKIRRKMANLTQEGLAEKAKVSTATISRMETGRQMVSVARLVEIAGAMNSQVGPLFVDFDCKIKSEQKEVDIQLEALLKKCSAEQKKYILDYVQFYLTHPTTN